MKNAKNVIIIFTILIMSVLFFSCKGSTGEAGAEGPTGPAGGSAANVIVLQQSDLYDGVQDTRLYEGYSTPLGGNDYMQLGYTGSDRKRGLIKFDLSGIPENITVTRAYLVLYNNGFISNTQIEFALYKAQEDWAELEATWTNSFTATAWTPAGGDFESSACSDAKTIDTQYGEYIFQLSSYLVQGWIDGSIPNYGVFIRSTHEDLIMQASFHTSEYSDASVRPKLIIHYNLP